MELVVTRAHFYPDCCISDLSVNGQRECFVLEDPVREIDGIPVEDWKIPGATAIPYGRYQVAVDKSQRFKKLLPRLLEVPGFSGVRIHSGNSPEDTQGCLLVGATWAHEKHNWIGNSSAAFAALLSKLQAALAAGEECWVTILKNPANVRPADTEATCAKS